MYEVNKSRTLYFDARSSRIEIMSALLTEQGFRDQLHQYKRLQRIEKGCINTVVIAQHKLTGARVAIKSIQKDHYFKRQKIERVSEAESLELCKDSPYLVNLVEKFTIGEEIFLVTKFAAGGDLTRFCMRRMEACFKDG